MLPPYGRTVNPTSVSTVYIFAGYHSQVAPHVGHRMRDTIGFYCFLDPAVYSWPVAGRDCIVFCWFKPDDEYLERIAYSLFLNGAKRVAVYSLYSHSQITYTRN